MSNETITIDTIPQVKMQICTHCIVCNESIILSEWDETIVRFGGHIHSRMCDKCKAAILHMREQMS